ncbi:MAG: carboxypeptidase-like regulatory domain-containing protein [Saprospiraceae bacterium]|nr:carboxypeptidase-like regulatory domain-containing protein [Saprospiraceae bacterium]
MKTFNLRNSVFILVSFFQTAVLQAADFQVAGTIKDRDTKQAIPYVNIGIPGTSIGTASYEDGTFSLHIPDKYLKDTIYFSAIGYSLLKMPIQKFTQQEPIILWMNKEAVQLQEVVVRSKKGKSSKEKLLSQGLFIKRKSNSSTALSSKTGGAAMALMMNEKSQNLLLQSATIYIHENELPEFKLRCRIVSVEEGLPGKDLLNENVIISSSIPNGLLSVNLSSYNLLIDKPFFLVFEWIVDKSLLDYYNYLETHRPAWWPKGAGIENRKFVIEKDANGKEIKRVPMTKEQQAEYEQIRLRTTYYATKGSPLKGYRRYSSMGNWEETTRDMVASISYSLADH